MLSRSFDTKSAPLLHPTYMHIHKPIKIACSNVAKGKHGGGVMWYILIARNSDYVTLRSGGQNTAITH